MESHVLNDLSIEAGEVQHNGTEKCDVLVLIGFATHAFDLKSGVFRLIVHSANCVVCVDSVVAVGGLTAHPRVCLGDHDIPKHISRLMVIEWKHAAGQDLHRRILAVRGHQLNPFQIIEVIEPGIFEQLVNIPMHIFHFCIQQPLEVAWFVPGPQMHRPLSSSSVKGSFRGLLKRSLHAFKCPQLLVNASPQLGVLSLDLQVLKSLPFGHTLPQLIVFIRIPSALLGHTRFLCLQLPF